MLKGTISSSAAVWFTTGNMNINCVIVRMCAVGVSAVMHISVEHSKAADWRQETGVQRVGSVFVNE